MSRHQWIDSHCHFNDARIRDQLEDWIRQADSLQIQSWILGGVCPEEWTTQLELASRFPGRFYCSFGLHPWWLLHPDRKNSEIELAQSDLEVQLRKNPQAAVGETGIDLYYPSLQSRSGRNEQVAQEELEKQVQIFRFHLRLAVRLDRPLVLHIVRAHPLALSVLREELKSMGGGRIRGLVHSFSDDVEKAKEYLDLGLIPSISASVLARGKGSAFEKLRKTVVTLSAKEMVFETDLPDQSPEGKATLNRPETLLWVAQEVARLRDRGESFEELLDQSAETLRSVFRVS